MSEARPWWQTGVIIQVYPRSFQDSDGDGIGDLRGIRARLPYLASLGVDAIWLSPVYVSPMADFGYDIADHRAIDPLFGDMADFDALLADAHALGLRIILDLVPNHTSAEHPWFVESRASLTNPKRDWYIWRDPAPGGPPNNWRAHFGGSAWQRDPATGQYYYHAYLPEQPDLDWTNPEVRAAMHGVMRFWLDKGVDGFRVDVLWHLAKDATLRDNPDNPDWRPGMPAVERLSQTYSADRPEVHAIVAGLRAVVDEYPDRVLIGEVYLPVDRLVAYYGDALGGAHLPFNFHLIETRWTAAAIADLVDRYEAALPPGAWPNWVLSNHDRPRIAARVGERQARLAAMLLLTLRGTPTLYYGDEIGLAAPEIPAAQAADPWGLAEPAFGRDSARTPMQWDTAANAGFTTAAPWLPLSADWPTRNVAAQSGATESMLALYRRLLAARRAHSALRTGAYTRLLLDGDVLAYRRGTGPDALAIALNFGRTERRIALDGFGTLVLAPEQGLLLAPGGGAICAT